MELKRESPTGGCAILVVRKGFECHEYCCTYRPSRRVPERYPSCTALECFRSPELVVASLFPKHVFYSQTPYAPLNPFSFPEIHQSNHRLRNPSALTNSCASRSD